MFIFLILGAIIGSLSVVFVAQNMTPISVTFLSFEIEGSMAVILTITFVGGVLMTALFSIPGLISDWIESARLRRRIRSLEEELTETKKQKEEIKVTTTHSTTEHGSEPHLY